MARKVVSKAKVTKPVKKTPVRKTVKPSTTTKTVKSVEKVTTASKIVINACENGFHVSVTSGDDPISYVEPSARKVVVRVKAALGL